MLLQNARPHDVVVAASVEIVALSVYSDGTFLSGAPTVTSEEVVG